MFSLSGCLLVDKLDYTILKLKKVIENKILLNMIYEIFVSVLESNIRILKYRLKMKSNENS